MPEKGSVSKLQVMRTSSSDADADVQAKAEQTSLNRNSALKYFIEREKTEWIEKFPFQPPSSISKLCSFWWKKLLR